MLETTPAVLAGDLGENDQREDYLRARLARDEDGNLTATAFAKQDSSMLSRLAAADCLIIRPPFAPAVAAGTTIDVVVLSHLGY